MTDLPINQLITSLLADSSRSLTPDEAADLRRMIADSPAAAALPMALLLRHGGDLIDSDTRSRYRQQLALIATDRHALLALADLDDADLDFMLGHSEKSAAGSMTTDAAIDTFLNTYGHRTPDDDALLERLIFNPVPDYSEVLAAQERELAENGEQPEMVEMSELLEIAKTSEPSETAETTETAEPAETTEVAEPDEPAKPDEPTQAEAQAQGLLSESLAKIFIKQGRYERAYEIISDLSLNYPKKSIYFADQLRFLQKLILIKQTTEQK